MIKRQNIWISMLCIITTISLSACGDGSGTAEGLLQEAVTIHSEPLMSATERAICDLEIKYQTGTFTMEDYHALADLYCEVGRIRRQRDMLEQGYRLYDDEAAFEALQDIAVNLAEEDEAIVSEAQTMLNNLELPEYLDESINLISTGEWITTMMPKLYEGKRNYFLQKDGQTILTIQTGYDDTGVPYSNVWYLGEENQMILLQYQNQTIQLLQTLMEDGAYNGAFEAWLVDGATGNIRHEQGGFTDGIYTGDYTASVRVGTEGSDLFALWCNREGMEYVTYTGHFDEQGRTTLEQPEEENVKSLAEIAGKSGCVVYAYDETGENCLFQGLEEGMAPEEYSFDPVQLGIAAYPTFTVYEVEDNTENETEVEVMSESNGMPDNKSDDSPQIRIYDGEIQWYNGNRWITMGSTEQYSKEDPFRTYAQKNEEGKSNITATGTESEQQTETGAGVGSITKKPTATTSKPTSNTTSSVAKPATNTTKPSTPASPVVTPAPTPAPAPAPEPEPDYSYDDDDDDDDDGGDNSAPDPAPAPDTEPEPPAESGGGDTDIEWSPDIM